mmetsp:Transcript_12639/g.14458  ORF Transcript_12639/g.14458 Transcript_12639/m.14458 type:complete len:328 (-) Transcript_12639:148-1131(-)
MMNIDEEHKKMIESTQFAFVVAQSGVGKTFTGDYLEAIRGWKHIDGDMPIKNIDTSPEYSDMTDQLLGKGNYAEKDDEWRLTEGWKPYMQELARLTLEGAKDSNKVVLTHASFKVPQRLFLRQQLIDAGVHDVSMIFLECDFDAHMDAVWKRYLRLAGQNGTTLEELFKGWGVEGIVDFGSFVKCQKEWGLMYQEPHDSEKPFTVIDNTAKDMTVLDSYDMALGIQDKHRGDLTYSQLVEKIKDADIKRDQKWMDRKNATASSEEKEVAKKDPKKIAARRSSLLELDKINSLRRWSSCSSNNNANIRVSDSSDSLRRQSFILTGKFD